MGIYRGDRLDRLVPVPRMTDAFPGFFSIAATAGERLQLAVDNPTGEEQAFMIQIFRQEPSENDRFDAAVELKGLTPTWPAWMYGATSEPGEPGHLGGTPRASCWWRWTAPRTLDMLLSLPSAPGFNKPAIVVYRGETLGSLVQVADNLEGGVPTEAFSFRAEAGVTYQIAVEDEPGMADQYRLSLSPIKLPANDSFAGRLPLTGMGRPEAASSLGATLEPGEPELDGPRVGASLWWSWRAPASGWATLRTQGGGLDTRLAVFKGTTLATLQLVAVNDDAEAGPFEVSSGHSQVGFAAREGVTYQIQVAGVAGRPGLIQLEWLGLDIPPVRLIGVVPPASDFDLPQLRLRGTKGQQVWIYVSEELPYWNWVDSTTLSTSGDTHWLDTSRRWPSKFYRVESSP